ncbi:MAG: hypothetical protein KAX31_06090 [Thermoplasmata archaeon]|nr:hypothetical protein [Thermoplasmata archaeon]
MLGKINFSALGKRKVIAIAIAVTLATVGISQLVWHSIENGQTTPLVPDMLISKTPQDNVKPPSRQNKPKYDDAIIDNPNKTVEEKLAPQLDLILSSYESEDISFIIVENNVSIIARFIEELSPEKIAGLEEEYGLEFNRDHNGNVVEVGRKYPMIIPIEQLRDFTNRSDVTYVYDGDEKLYIHLDDSIPVVNADIAWSGTPDYTGEDGVWDQPSGGTSSWVFNRHRTF